MDHWASDNLKKGSNDVVSLLCDSSVELDVDGEQALIPNVPIPAPANARFLTKILLFILG